MKFEESEKLELKESLNETLEKEVEAFLNTFTGKIIIGINNSGIVVGLKQSVDETMKKISDRLVTGIYPEAKNYINIHKENYDGIDVVEIDVKKGNLNLYCIASHGFSPSGCHIRFGTTCRMMDNSEITRRFNLDHLIAPKLINVDSKEQDLSFKDFLFLYHQKGKDVKNEKVFLRNKHFMTESGKYNRLADLFADVNHLSLLFCRFDGKTKEFPVQRVEYGKQNLIIGSKKVLDYARDIINTTQIKITGEAEREELRLFDDKSFREGWLNAIQYTDYLHESYPRVFAFSDRIEIESYGGLPKGLSLDEFFEGTHYSVSPELTEILMELDHIEHIGHGVPYIVSKYGKEAFHISDHTVKVIIPFRYLDNSILQDIPIVEQPSLTADQIKIIDYIKQNGSIRRSDVETLLDVKKRKANNILKK